MLKIATCLWQPNEKSFSFSRDYDESWVEKLYRGFQRNLTIPFEFHCFVDNPAQYKFTENIKVQRLDSISPGYDAYINPFKLDGPLLVVGLDTVIVGNLDHIAQAAIDGDTLLLPKDPYFDRACNAIAVVPPNHSEIYDTHDGQNDMDWLNTFDHKYIDDTWPDQVVSYKKHVRMQEWKDFRIVYFHGNPKMNVLEKLDWIRESWV